VNKRIFYGWLLFLLALVAIAAGGVVLALLIGFCAYQSGEEFIIMAQAKGYKPSVRIVKAMILAFFAMAALPYAIPQLFPSVHLPATFAVEHFPLLLLIGICCSFFRLLFRHETPPATIADISTTILGFIYIGFLPSHLILIRNLAPPGESHFDNLLLQPGIAYVAASLFAVLATDVFAYLVGRHWGKTRLYPQVSPKKTVEGALGGFVASIFWTTLTVWGFETYFPGHPFKGNLWQAPFMGAAVSVAAQLGDLCESLLKRDAGMKDSSQNLPGHGGFLDRADSLLFGAPIAYYWICLVVLHIL
jgi:phosphatidate cytidylyltransferase